MSASAANISDTYYYDVLIDDQESHTGYRSKHNDSSMYIYNYGDVQLRVEAWGSDTFGNERNKTANGSYVYVPIGQYRVQNYINEDGYISAEFQIQKASPNPVNERIEGAWSPDCAGSYPVATR